MKQWFNKISCQGALDYLLHRDGVSQTGGRPSLWVTKFRDDTLVFLTSTQKSLDAPEFIPSPKLNERFMSE